MTDTPGTVIIKDGGSPSTARPEMVMFDQTLTNFAFQRVPRVNGAPVDDTNPLPSRAPPIAPNAASSLGSGFVLSEGPCTLFSLQVNTTSAGGFVMLFDADAVPADGTVTPKKIWQVLANSTLDRFFSPPLQMLDGAALAFSTTGPFAKTASPTAVFSGETG